MTFEVNAMSIKVKQKSLQFGRRKVGHRPEGSSFEVWLTLNRTYLIRGCSVARLELQVGGQQLAEHDVLRVRRASGVGEAALLRAVHHLDAQRRPVPTYRFSL